jgi:hypothetical protein
LTNMNNFRLVQNLMGPLAPNKQKYELYNGVQTRSSVGFFVGLQLGTTQHSGQPGYKHACLCDVLAPTVVARNGVLFLITTGGENEQVDAEAQEVSSPVPRRDGIGHVDEHLSSVGGVADVAVHAIRDQMPWVVLQHEVGLCIGGYHDGDPHGMYRDGKRHALAGCGTLAGIHGKEHVRNQPVGVQKREDDKESGGVGGRRLEALVGESKVLNHPAVAVRPMQRQVDPRAGGVVVEDMHQVEDEERSGDFLRVDQPTELEVFGTTHKLVETVVDHSAQGSRPQRRQHFLILIFRHFS